MQLPFTTDQFYGVFREYNTAVWPAQVLFAGLALVAVAMVAFPRRWSGPGVSAILALLWSWLGLAYHLAFFAAINPLAYAFAAISVAGSVLFLWHGVLRQRLQFRLAANTRSVIALLLVAFALAIYPAWSIQAGHHYPELPTFGLPCPTTIFTIGVLALAKTPHPRSVLFVPVLWSLIGGQAAFLLGVPQDLGLLVAGAVGVVLIARAKHSPHTQAASA
jgi:hypothetical protein